MARILFYLFKRLRHTATLAISCICLVQTASASNEAQPSSSIPVLGVGESELYAQAVDLNRRGFDLYQAGDYEGAIAIFAEAVRFSRQRLGEKQRVTLTSLSNYAAVLDSLGRMAEAEPLLADVLRLKRTTLGNRNPETISSLNNYAAVLLGLGREEEAEPLFEEALQLRREVLGENHPDTLGSLSNYASILKRLERPAEAEPIFARALSLNRELLGPDHPDTVIMLNNYAGVLTDLGRSAEAEPLMADVLAARLRILGERHPDTLTAMNNHAVVLQDLGRSTQAAPLFETALRLRRTVLGERHPLTIATLINHGFALDALGQRTAALALFEQGRGLSEGVMGTQHPTTLIVAGKLASLYLDANQPARSLDLALQASSGWQARRILLADGPGGEAQQERNGKSEAGYLALVADAAWTTATTETPRLPVLQATVFGVVQDLLSGSASKAIRLTAARQAIQSSEGLPEKARRLQALNDAWKKADSEYVTAIGSTDPTSKAGIQGLRERLKLIVAEIDSLTVELRRDAPEYFSLIQPRALSQMEAQTLMRGDEAAIMLVPSERGTHVLVTTASGTTWHRSSWTKTKVDAAVTRLLWDVGAGPPVALDMAARWENEGQGAYPYDFATAHALYQQIIEPVAGYLKGKTHVFVMASGSLASLPLGILVTEIPPGANGDPKVLRSAKWLADRYALITVPNLQAIRLLRGSQPAAGRTRRGRFLGIGDPVLGGTSATRGVRNRGTAVGPAPSRFATLFSKPAGSRVEATVEVNELQKMARLPGTATELKAMWQAFGQPKNTLFLANAATEPGVRALNLSADVLAFATHGLLAGEIGGIAEPGLVLTPPATGRIGNDGYLSTSEIAELSIDADWVVLSACNTASGDGSAGASGLSGLARAFFYAGARNLLVSHWPVRDDVAAEITVRTITNGLNDPGVSRAQALQRAMQDIRNNPVADTATDTWAHPSAWAPFVLVGDR